MSTKQEIINGLVKASYKKHEVVKMIQSVKNTSTKPDKLQIGDCFIDFKGVKARPHIIFNIDGGLAYALALTTTKDEFYLSDAKLSRFFDPKISNSYFAKGIITVKAGYAAENYCFSYEHLDCLIDAVEKQLSLLNFITI